MKYNSFEGLQFEMRQVIPDSKSPPFTLQQLRNAIPKHCFEPSAVRSASYAIRDLFFAVILWAFVAPWIDAISVGGVAGVLIKSVLWTLFAMVQGTILTGVWVVAHEAGHGAFSTSDTVNAVAGTILHSFLLVPFFSWKFTHAAHHGATNHLRKDQVFVPQTKTEALPHRSFYETIEDTPILNLLLAIRMFLLGWPAYLLLNISGQESQSFSSHFLPNSPIFNKDQRKLVTFSNWALLVMLGLLSVYINRLGFAHFATRYLGPYLVVNFWLIFYTFLQHTDKSLPHYDESEWNFVRGALATIDRPYHMFDFFHHEIGTSHVLHHFFSRIPHYYAAEATAAIKPILGKYYMSSNENVFAAFWEQYRDCKFVASEDQDGVMWFKKSHRHVK